MSSARVIAFIGSAGVPNRYGGFESFVEHCGPVIGERATRALVTCDAGLYSDRTEQFAGLRRIFVPIPANGKWSPLHDLVAFAMVFAAASHILVLGVSGGLWFPVFRLACAVTGKRLLVNVDGIEWRRTKFGRGRRALLFVLDQLAQAFAHTVIYDNEGLRPYLTRRGARKAVCIAYSGDHVMRIASVAREPRTALTVCRIEPENNLELLIQGALGSVTLRQYTIVGNWNGSAYGRALRARFQGQARLQLLDAIYDPAVLAELRERCEFYLHGHSVGGTNPSLVEMLFYDARLLCFDVSFNRETAADCAAYFRSPAELAALLDTANVPAGARDARRDRFRRERIAEQYLGALVR